MDMLPFSMFASHGVGNIISVHRFRIKKTEDTFFSSTYNIQYVKYKK